MMKVRCPICNRLMQGHGPKEWPAFPFCSARLSHDRPGPLVGRAISGRSRTPARRSQSRTTRTTPPKPAVSSAFLIEAEAWHKKATPSLFLRVTHPRLAASLWRARLKRARQRLAAKLLIARENARKRFVSQPSLHQRLQHLAPQPFR